MAGLRDLNKAKRRDAILDATVALFGQRPSDEVTTEEIAALAEVAPATVYNLIGTRDDVVRAVVARILAELADSLTQLDPTDPIAAASSSSIRPCRHSSPTPARSARSCGSRHGHRAWGPNSSDPSEFQVAAMRHAQQLGIIRPDIDAAALARQIYLSYTGAMTLWSTGRLDDDGFSTAARHGLYTALAAAAVDGERERFLDQLRVLGTTLETERWNRDSG
jgi:AcrR family transcriptional regulator